MNHLTIKRIIKDIDDLKKNNLETHGIYFKTFEDNIYNIKVLIIGTEDTPYQNGYYFFDIIIPQDYPFVPPKIKFCTQNNKTRFNPNLYLNGKVCLSIINTWIGPKWTSCNSLSSILLSLQAIVFIKNPLHNEPGFENDFSNRNNNYNKIISYQNINTSIYKMIINIPTGFNYFQSIITQKFIENYKYINTFIDKQKKYNNEIVEATVYNMKDKLNYIDLKKNINILYNNIISKK